MSPPPEHRISNIIAVLMSEVKEREDKVDETLSVRLTVSVYGDWSALQ